MQKELNNLFYYVNWRMDASIKAGKTFLVILVLIEWFALVAQGILHVQNRVTGIGESLVRFFSFFTILTNLLVAISCTVLLLDKSKSGFFHRPGVQTAIVLYILVVGLIYNTLLRQRWDSHGLQAVLHDLLHTVTPIMSLIYWWRWVDARNLQFKNIPRWLIYPAVYAVVIMVRGYLSDWYPYFFLDAGKLGFTKVLVNSAGMVLLFLVFAFLFVVIGKKKRVPVAVGND